MAALLCRLSSRIQRTFVTTALRACSSDSSGPPKNTSANVTKDEGHRPADLAGHKKVTLEQFYEDLNYRTERVNEDDIEEFVGDTVGIQGFELYETLRFGEAQPADPFDYALQSKLGRGSCANPILVPTLNQSYREVGCVCEEEDTTVMFTELHYGEKKPCRCGYWFQLVDVNIGEEKMPPGV